MLPWSFSIWLIALSTWAAHIGAQSPNAPGEPNQISFIQTDQGLIFTPIQVNGVEVLAMIDLGDAHTLQVSSTLLRELGIATESAGYQVSDVYGQVWDVLKGRVDSLVVGAWHMANVLFTSQEGEMEAVADMVGTEFHAVLGWAFFSPYYTQLDYAGGTFTLSATRDEPGDTGFPVPFRRDADQLIIGVNIDGREHALMLDTGSPITVIDEGILPGQGEGMLTFQLGPETVTLYAYSQDLSVLADLGVVGILGGDFLQGWRITIDPAGGVLFFDSTRP